jgi:hypothetical protein
MDDYSQPSLFDPAGAAQARSDGMARAEMGMNSDWGLAAVATVRYVAAKLPCFTADDVLANLPADAPRNDNPVALGPVFLKLARRGEILKTGHLRRSKIPRRHRDLTEWKAGPHLRTY